MGTKKCGGAGCYLFSHIIKRPKLNQGLFMKTFYQIKSSNSLTRLGWNGCGILISKILNKVLNTKMLSC